MTAPYDARPARRLPRLVLSLLVSGGFLYLAFRNVELDELTAALGRLHAGWLAAALGVSLLIMVLRAVRWHLELRPLARVPVGRLWVVTSVAYMAINLLPVRLGEVVRPWLLSRRASVSFSNVVGNLVVEKMMDSICIVFYLLLGLVLIDSLPVWVRRGALVPAGIAGVFVSVVVAFWWKGEAFVDRLLLNRLPARFAGRAKAVLASVTDGMRILPNPGLLLGVFGVSLAVWFLPILSSYVMIRAFALDAPFSAAVVIFIFISFGTALPNLPGMIGPYQYACQLALGIYGVSEADGLAYGLVLNAVQFLTLIAQGVVALPLAGVSFRDLRRAGAEVAAPSLRARSCPDSESPPDRRPA